jgi:hypothetical protein
MGRVKELAMWLAESVYISHLSAKEFMTTLASIIQIFSKLY